MWPSAAPRRAAHRTPRPAPTPPPTPHDRRLRYERDLTRHIRTVNADHAGRAGARGPAGVADWAVVETQIITVRTGNRPAVVDITAEAGRFTAGRGSGLLHVFVPHATAGVAIIETGSGTETDLLRALDDTLPTDDRWRHRHGSPGHGRDHVLPAFIAPYASLPVLDGQIALGTWQSICLVDPNGDNPVRQVRFSFLSAG